MSSTNYVTSIPIFQGIQGKFYLVDGYKYHPCFPIQWALDHMCFHSGEHENLSGPIGCENCAAYGSIRGVFVGYCSTCLNLCSKQGIWRGVLIAPGSDINELENLTIWQQYPYMYGIKKTEIGDEEEANVTYNCIEADDENQDYEPEPFVHNPYDSGSENDSDDDTFRRRLRT